MNRIVLGALIALALTGLGLFWWQGRAATERGAPPPDISAPESDGDAEDQALPTEDGAGQFGDPLELRADSALGITGPVTLAVHDWGGMIGFGWALSHHDQVKRLVVLNTAAFPMPAAKKMPAHPKSAPKIAPIQITWGVCAACVPRTCHDYLST